MNDLPHEERELLSVAMAMGADRVRGWSNAEQSLVADLPLTSATAVADVVRRVRAGADPLGDMFCRLRSPEVRRPSGATYTPASILKAMMRWSKRQPVPARIVDPGAGSGRFSVAAALTFPRAAVLGIEFDPVAAILCRASVVAAGVADRVEVRVADYRQVQLPALPEGEVTLFIGNPPYVRHHQIDQRWKNWLMYEGRKHGLHPSMLAGLHVHFFLATAKLVRKGDVGCFITSAEWLDTNYGRMVREMLLNGLGGTRLVVVEATAKPFPNAQTTAAISCMNVGSNPKSIFVQRVASTDDLGGLDGGRRVRRERFEAETRWSHLTRAAKKTPEGYVELGELCRVHRGAVTGANSIWITGDHSRDLPPSVLFSSITKARELYAAGRELRDTDQLRSVIDLPEDLGEFKGEDRKAVDRFLAYAKSHAAHEGYIARHRKPWWSVGLREPAPVLATYMSRRPPAFVRNRPGARHLNIAHGLYPRDAMSESLLGRLVAFLSSNICTSQGRTYAGGLTKFEPREMERLLVPEPASLAFGAFA